MADIINLRRARKLRERSSAAALAEQNRARHGRTKAEKASDDAAAVTATRQLDQARLDNLPEE